VLIFSHGFGGCAKQSTFLTEALAAHGYCVFAPNHTDARCGGGRPGLAGDRRSRSAIRCRWSDETFADPDDIRAIQQALVTSPAFPVVSTSPSWGTSVTRYVDMTVF